MSRSFLPDKDDAMLAFALNFSTLLTANYAAYGIPQAVANTYSSKYNTYKTALAAAQQPPTRGNATVLAKNQAKKDLVSYTRQVARTIGNNMAVSDLQRQALGLTIRKTTPTPIPAPSTRPTVALLDVSMRNVTVKIFDPASETSRAKTAGAIGAKVYTYVGAEYPTDPSMWAYDGDCTRSTHTITFPNSVANGAQVWIMAAWYGRRNGETGPISVPISTNVQGGGVSVQEQELKIAA